jgi:hypothetical protein
MEDLRWPEAWGGRHQSRPRGPRQGPGPKGALADTRRAMCPAQATRGPCPSPPPRPKQPRARGAPSSHYPSPLPHARRWPRSPCAPCRARARSCACRRAPWHSRCWPGLSSWSARPRTRSSGSRSGTPAQGRVRVRVSRIPCTAGAPWLRLGGELRARACRRPRRNLRVHAAPAARFGRPGRLLGCLGRLLSCGDRGRSGAVSELPALTRQLLVGGGPPGDTGGAPLRGAPGCRGSPRPRRPPCAC